jgi:Lrp/AsnC family transcriptional regulator for asnA, asnC and gidA
VCPADSPIREIEVGREQGASIRDSRGVLDQLSKRIIEQLQEDGRRSYAAIARAVGLSEAATRQRVQRLLDERIIQIAAVTDAAAVGFHRMALLGINVEGDIRAVADKLAGLERPSTW